MKKKKNNRKRLLIILIIVIIILMVLLIVWAKLKKANSNESFRQIDYEKEQKRIEEYFSDKVVPQGIYDFTMEYGGDVNRNDMYRQLYAITKYLPDLSKDLQENDASKYYEKNKEYIESCLGIDSEGEYDRLVDYLKKNDLSDATLEYCAYQKGSLTQIGNYWYFYMEFKYQNHDKITFYMRVLNLQNNEKSILKISVPK